ncbi:MAG: HAMP domain-containing sensor histidine kinase [Desulfuromonadales bacterium]|nr:HAMP domain-containing sensor histidine kinase [Desulfuromonadales bacterium]MDW7758552.1 HAMP domain-containing sensor histidine kinase [Desulfuromonadales bacterium]
MEEIDFLFHEIRTPLTAIISYAEILKTQNQSAEGHASLLDIIGREGRHIDALLNDFSEACQHDCGPWLADTRFSPIHVGDLLQEAVTRFSAKLNSHTIRLEIPACLSLIQGDEEKLYLVVRNLLANATKYSHPSHEIIVSVTEGSKDVTITVRDQGIGISQECLPEIFNQGFRGTLAKDKNLRGAGLGLAIVKRIVEGHRGQIEVKSKPGEGSLFLLSFPKIG